MRNLDILAAENGEHVRVLLCGEEQSYVVSCQHFQMPYVPDAKAFWEEKADAKKPVIKTGAEIPFTQYFYKYEQPVPSEELAKQFIELEQSVSQRIAKLFG